jgi:hypothetical protein
VSPVEESKNDRTMLDVVEGMLPTEGHAVAV